MTRRNREMSPKVSRRVFDTIQRFEEATKHLTKDQQASLFCDLMDDYLIKSPTVLVNPPAFFGDK